MNNKLILGVSIVLVLAVGFVLGMTVLGHGSSIKIDILNGVIEIHGEGELPIGTLANEDGSLVFIQDDGTKVSLRGWLAARGYVITYDPENKVVTAKK